MAGRKKNNAKSEEWRVLERQQRVAALYIQGVTQAQIAKQVGVSTSLVCIDLGKIRKMWLASAIRNFDERKAEELARIDHLEARANEAFDRSCLDAETKKKVVERELRDKKLALKLKKDGKPELAEKVMTPVRENYEQTKKGQSGNPAFLSIVAQCIDMRCKIFNLYKDEKTTNVNQVTIFTKLEDFFKASAVEDPMEKVLEEKGLVTPALPHPEKNGDGQ